jgi:uncharacterized protein YodC (DUF2158 family)
MQTSWPGVGKDSSYDQYGNVYCEWQDRSGHRYANKMLLCPWGKSMDAVRAEAAAFHSNVLVPEGWLYVCTHCGSRRMDRYGLSAYSDDDSDPYVWGPECIRNAILVSEEEYQQGRAIYDLKNTKGG